MSEQNATATAENTNNAAASTEASATSLATAADTADKQTPPAGTQTSQATEKPAEKPAEQPAEKPAEKPATEGAPEKYEDFTVPDGAAVDPRDLAAYASAAKAANLSQGAAQKLIETMVPAMAARQAEQLTALHQEWIDSSTADKEFGGEKFKENLGLVRKALDMFDPVPKDAKSTTLRTLLDTTGFGNHPEMIRLLYRAGKAISEDKFVGGNPRGSGGKDVTAVLYDQTK